MERFENIYNRYVNVIEDILLDGFPMLSETPSYKEANKKFKELNTKMLEKCSNEELENFEQAMYDLDRLEDVYIYLKGMQDGMDIKEILNDFTINL